MKKDTTKIKSIENKLLVIRGQYVLLDSDIAAVYGVETREINEEPSSKLLGIFVG